MYRNKFMKPYKPVGGPYNFHLKPIRETKIRNPVKYLVDKHKMSKKHAKEWLAQPAVIERDWKEDNSGLYMDKKMLDIIGYGWKHEREEIVSTLESTERVREASRKYMRKEYGKDLTQKEMEEKLVEKLTEYGDKIPIHQQKKLYKIQRVMKKLRS